MYILHVNTDNELAGGKTPGCIPELLIEGDNHSSTAHIIIRCDDDEKFQRIFQKILEHNPALRAEVFAGAIAIGHIPGSPQSNKINDLKVVPFNDYEFRVFVREASQPIEQRLFDEDQIKALLKIDSFQE
jgi:hypothetical protein